MALRADPNFKVSVDTLKIDPSLGVMNQGTIDIKAPPTSSDTGEPHLPAVVGSNVPVVRKKPFLHLKPGTTLAERLGTEENVQQQEIMPTAPISVPERVVPVIERARNLSADEMGSILTPKFKPPPDSITEAQQPPEIAPTEHKSDTVPVVTPVKADLKGLVLRFIQKVGPEEAAKFFGKTLTTINGWVNGKTEPPLAAAQALLDKSPKAREQYLKVAERVSIDFETGEGSFERDHTKEDLPVDLCLCTDKDIPPYVHWVFVTATAQYGLGEKMQTDTILPRSRNMVAEMFLRGKATWSIWLDYDVLPTIGNAPWWRAITRDLGASAQVTEQTASYDFIKRLLSHNKPFVGGVYATRRKGGPLVTQLDLHPRGQADRIASDQQRKNKATGLYGPVEWLSTGFAIIHRIVFETIRRNHPQWQPSLKGEPYPFFTQMASEGEDVAFSKRALDAGFKLYLDQELFAAHIGRYPFLPGESAYNGPVDITNAYS